VLDYIRAQDWVTYAEIEKVLAPYIQVAGNGGVEMGDFANVVLWGGVSRAFVDTVHEVLCTQLVCRQPVPVLSYLLDGTSLTLPLAKRLRAYAKTPLAACVLPARRTLRGAGAATAGDTQTAEKARLAKHRGSRTMHDQPISSNAGEGAQGRSGRPRTYATDAARKLTWYHRQRQTGESEWPAAPARRGRA
jgi:hypothetical protein